MSAGDRPFTPPGTDPARVLRPNATRLGAMSVGARRPAGGEEESIMSWRDVAVGLGHLMKGLGRGR
jgi:hypothetical protein